MPLKGFEKLFDTALKQSSEDENMVVEAANDLRMKGYNPCEILETLVGLKKKCIQDEDITYLQEAIEEMEGWCVQ